MIERKCLKCYTWNQDERFCKSCGAALAPEEIIKEEDEKKAFIESQKAPDKLDILLNKAKHSKYLLVRILFYIFYSVAMVVFAIASFVAYLVAWSPG
ncbi:MAG: hypothetical protein IPH24_00490 [Crocinitomicaceae bacterium]|nr:hypothetical protein [Crocinitomicaceae bacterium]